MTDVQRKMAEENHDMIYWFMNRKNIPMDDYDIYALAYLRGIMTYNSNIGELSTHIVNVMENERKSTYRNSMRKKRQAETISFDLEFDGKDNSKMTLGDMIEDVSANSYEDVECEAFAEDFISTLGESEKVILLEKYRNGESCSKKIAEKMGLSRQRVNVIEKRIQKKFIEYQKKCGVCCR